MKGYILISVVSQVLPSKGLIRHVSLYYFYEKFPFQFLGSAFALPPEILEKHKNVAVMINPDEILNPNSVDSSNDVSGEAFIQIVCLLFTFYNF